jgi:hypothetical protein
MKKKIKHIENTYTEVVRYCSLSIPVASIWSKPLVLSSSGELRVSIPGQYHHTWVVEKNQVTQHQVD